VPVNHIMISPEACALLLAAEASAARCANAMDTSVMNLKATYRVSATQIVLDECLNPQRSLQPWLPRRCFTKHSGYQCHCDFYTDGPKRRSLLLPHMCQWWLDNGTRYPWAYLLKSLIGMYQDNPGMYLVCTSTYTKKAKCLIMHDTGNQTQDLVHTNQLVIVRPLCHQRAIFGDMNG
jgi:hypothetical protein